MALFLVEQAGHHRPKTTGNFIHKPEALSDIFEINEFSAVFEVGDQSL